MLLTIRNFHVTCCWRPRRTKELNYCLLDSYSDEYLVLTPDSFLRPLGVQHFYDSFSIESNIGIRDEAVALFGLQEGEVLPDLRISEVAVQRKQWGHHFEQPIDQTARAADPQRVPDDVISIYFDEQDQDSDDDDSDTASDSALTPGGGYRRLWANETGIPSGGYSDPSRWRYVGWWIWNIEQPWTCPPKLALGKTYFPVAKNDLLFGSLDGRVLLGSLGIPS